MTREEMLDGYDNEHIFIGTLMSLCNQMQAAGDAFYNEITFKQFYLLICLNLFRGNAPTINELSDVMGSSHQNVKQIALKLEKNGFIKTYVDPEDRRKLRIAMTDKMEWLNEKYDSSVNEFFKTMYQNIDAEELAIALKTICKIEYNIRSMKGVCK
jgi:DNA-binding MarR family transcriptional regulator